MQWQLKQACCKGHRSCKSHLVGQAGSSTVVFSNLTGHGTAPACFHSQYTAGIAVAVWRVTGIKAQTERTPMTMNRKAQVHANSASTACSTRANTQI